MIHTDFRAATAAPTFFPQAPRSVEETGLPFLFLVEMAAKVLFLRGQVRLIELAAHLKLLNSVLHPVIDFMRAEKLCEATRRGGSGTDADLGYQLTDLGRTRAAEYLARNSYAGATPVTLAAYCQQVETQSVTAMRVTREDMARGFADLVVNPAVLEQLGAAMNSRRAIFIHGPAGSGKTYLAERLARLLKGVVWVPHAIYVESQVMQFYDPIVHRPVNVAAAQTNAFDKPVLLDARWASCARPAVLTGGELTLGMLDLQFDPGTRLYQAPPHLKANNGIFIIDDLGRQRCSATELMNRWIVPMDCRHDYLTLHTGYKFDLPFDVIVVFSSNFPPEELMDGSFLRRLGYKIHVGPLTEAEYQKVFVETCALFGVPFSIDAFHYLLQEHHYKENRPLLACYPRDILSQVRDIAIYEARDACLDPQVLDWAWNNYFAGSRTSERSTLGERQ